MYIKNKSFVRNFFKVYENFPIVQKETNTIKYLFLFDYLFKALKIVLLLTVLPYLQAP